MPNRIKCRFEVNKVKKVMLLVVLVAFSDNFQVPNLLHSNLSSFDIASYCSVILLVNVVKIDSVQGWDHSL